MLGLPLKTLYEMYCADEIPPHQLRALMANEMFKAYCRRRERR